MDDSNISEVPGKIEEIVILPSSMLELIHTLEFLTPSHTYQSKTLPEEEGAAWKFSISTWNRIESYAAIHVSSGG